MNTDGIMKGNYLRHKDYGFVIVELEDFNGWNFNDVEPVPISEEMLLKLGFECKDPVNGGYIRIIDKYRSLTLYCSKRGVVALIDQITTYKDIVLNKHYEYVHELQNLYFILSGIKINPS